MSTTPNGTTPEKIKIVLTNARAVMIVDANWPYIATATDKTYDNQYEFQANRITKWDLDVRQHAKGCTLVYGRYRHTSAWLNERDFTARAGVKLKPGEDIISAINHVGRLLEDAVADVNSSDALRFRALRNECIADLPTEDLDCCPEAA